MRSTLEHSFSVTWGHSALHLGISVQFGYAVLLQNTLSQLHVTIRPCAWGFQYNSAMRPALKHSFSVTCGHSALHLGISVQFGYAVLLQNTLSQLHVTIRPCAWGFQYNSAMRPALKHSFSVTCGHSALHLGISVQFGYAVLLQNTLSQLHVTIRPCAWGFQYNSAMRPALKHSFSVTWGHSALHLGDFSPIRLCGLHQNILSQSHVAMRPCFQEIPVQVGHAAFIRTFLLSHI